MAHILVVDDEPDIVKLVVKVLESRGHRVSSAKDGREDEANRRFPSRLSFANFAPSRLCSIASLNPEP